MRATASMAVSRTHQSGSLDAACISARSEAGIPRDARARTVRLRRHEQPFAGTEAAVSGALQRPFSRRVVTVQYTGCENRRGGLVDSPKICPATARLLFATGVA